MDFLLLRFAHLIGLMLMSAGLIGVFVADMRSRQIHDVKLFAQAVTFIAGLYRESQAAVSDLSRGTAHGPPTEPLRQSAPASALNSHCDSGPASSPIRLKR
jgi:hypothetical protein